jgi:hypothetical protein
MSPEESNIMIALITGISTLLVGLFGGHKLKEVNDRKAALASGVDSEVSCELCKDPVPVIQNIAIIPEIQKSVAKIENALNADSGIFTRLRLVESKTEKLDERTRGL